MRLAREALLAATMSLIPAAPVDVFRFLNVPAIVWVLRRVRGRVCRDAHTHHARRRVISASPAKAEK